MPTAMRSVDGAIIADANAVDCADLRLTITDVTLVEGASGSINVTSDAADTTARLFDSAVPGNLTLRGPHGSQTFAARRPSVPM